MTELCRNVIGEFRRIRETVGYIGISSSVGSYVHRLAQEGAIDDRL